ncbi:DUF1015 domain-containing protein [Breznakiella homolactica]|uniref:DUF1015 domain-containing protein n=1 Tax=Breznakiella homolactica TaxID=2798577 RepID=A0A7T7XNA7_9SPIR|nr:DUF1015 domain-containing protein [Breznakiella homolactica]QQO09461.1 DUF1015 domain-containing protein [Breznakiella homolactica]
MPTVYERLAGFGTAVPEILIPKEEIPLGVWSVIACDQFTQDRRYWEQAARHAGENPSTINLIFPEIYLEDGSREERIRDIHRSMDGYIREGVFAPPFRGFIYIERSTPYTPCRKGIIAAVDLEQYDWAPESRPLIRSTEGTVPERIPPRVAIRRGAPMESPHVILLIDDAGDTILKTLGARAKKAPPLYSGPLMMESGGITGWPLKREEDWSVLADGLENLAETANSRYGTDGSVPFLFAVGDGNHSLATAKAVWEEYKKAHAGEPGLMEHPARYALAEIENIYDPGITFEPIHRVIFGADLPEVTETLSALPGLAVRPAGSREELARLIGDGSSGKNRYGLVSGDQCVLLESDAPGIATDALQPLLDGFIAAAPGRSIDYIHGAEEIFRISREKPREAVGILLPPIKKEDLFRTVARSGPLPRKSFSMGEAAEKRFYLECRRLFS